MNIKKSKTLEWEQWGDSFKCRSIPGLVLILSFWPGRIYYSLNIICHDGAGGEDFKLNKFLYSANDFSNFSASSFEDAQSKDPNMLRKVARYSITNHKKSYSSFLKKISRLK